MNYAVDELAFDVEESKRRLDVDDSQFNRRVYVRSLFSYYEGFGYFVRQFLVEIEKIKMGKGVPIHQGHLFLLQERIPTIGKNGKVKERVQKVPFADRFAFALRVFAGLVKMDKHIFEDKGWQAIQEALEVRDRLTHPKEKKDLLVSDGDLELCQTGYAWFASLIVVQFREAANKLQ